MVSESSYETVGSNEDRQNAGAEAGVSTQNNVKSDAQP